MPDARMLQSPDIFAQLVAHADLALQSLCRQISADYLTFMKTHVIEDVPGCKDLNIKEIMVLLLIDATEQKMMRSHEVATVLRVDASTVSRGVYSLVAKGYLLADDDVYDNRSKVFTLTGKSEQYLKDYRERCVEAIKDANERLHISGNEHDALVQTGYEVFYRLKDRAAAFKGINFKYTQRFRPGQGRARPAQTPSDDYLYVFSDYVFRIFADQISTDYLGFMKKHIIRDMNTIQKLALREIRVLMAIDFFVDPVTASDVATLMSMEAATMSRGVSVLTKMGLIEGRENYEDGRSKLLQTTDAGKAYAEKYKEISRNQVKRAEEHLGFNWDYEARSKAIMALHTVKLRSASLAALKRRNGGRGTLTEPRSDMPKNEAQPAETGYKMFAEPATDLGFYQAERKQV